VRRASLGSLQVSVIGLGCNNFGRALDAAASATVVNAALEAGMNYFDTADNYGDAQSESFLGRALKGRRSEVVIATKFGMAVPGEPGTGGARPEYVRSAVRRSLAQLDTDWIDLYQLHRPDPATPIGDTLEAMWQLVEEGLVREIGCSNLDASQLTEALAYSGEKGGRPFASDQVEYSLLNREIESNGLGDVATRERIAVLPFYPLACGMLTGKAKRDQPLEGRLAMGRYERFLTAHNFDVVEEIRAFAELRGITMPQVALGWLMAQPAVPAITPGATSPAQIGSNALAAEWIPDQTELATLDAITAL
jgi:aryl-alcohol dehydrogenase-like predicted oxidoreductase